MSSPVEEASEPDASPAQGDAPAAGRTLTDRTLSAAQWRFATAVVQGVLQFGVGVLLAHLLGPDDFGVVALAMVVVGFATLLANLGLGAALIQRRGLTGRHLRVAFTASVLFGAAVAGGLVLLSPLAAVLLDNAEVPAVLRLQSLLFVLSGLGATAAALLRRQLRFQPLFWIGLASYLVGYAGVAVALALTGFGVWSLVFGALAQALLENVLLLVVVRPPVRPLLARAELKDLFGYGAGVSLNNVVNYAARNGDNLIVGRWLGAAALGLYGRAYNLMDLPVNYLGTVIESVLFPAMSEVQHDRERLGRAYLVSVQVIALVAAPIMAGMIVAAPHLVPALYGDAWGGMVAPLQVLCVAGLFRAVYKTAGTVTFASGRVYSELKRQAVYAALVIAGGLAGTAWGPAGVAVGVTVAILYMYVAVSRLALGIVGRSWGEFAAAQAPGLVLAAMVGAAALVVRVALERLGYGSGWIFLGMLAACAAMVPAGVYLLPHRLRPVAVFRRVETMVGRLPGPARRAVGGILRLEPGRAA